MQVIPLYVYTREDGGTTVSLNKPDCEYIENVRIIADEGKVITNGAEFYNCIDTTSTNGWYDFTLVEDEEYSWR